MLAVEHKSQGKSLDEALGQAVDYMDSLSEAELPKLVVASDFARFKVWDQESRTTIDFPMESLPEHLELFGYLAGYRQRVFAEEDPVNVKAALLMAGLYDDLTAAGYVGHPLNVLLVRLMFMFFADDTGVWPRGLFQEFLEKHTSEDGLDVGPMLARLFQILNTSEVKRLAGLDPSIAQFPYINGGLFKEQLGIADFTGRMRSRLLAISSFDWSQISPIVFGSMFQGVMDQASRRSFGAHYTPESSIRRVIEPLFLDDLVGEYVRAKNSAPALKRLHNRLGSLRFLDPAAGAGNFLLVTFRALRQLEFDILMRLRELGALEATWAMDTSHFSKVTVDQFYAIEVEEFPARIAETALYLADHLENMRLSKEFGEHFARFPIVLEAHIHTENALRVDWNDVLPAKDCNYVLGNPPFIGRQYRTEEQVRDMEVAFQGARGVGPLDYVTAWYAKSLEYLKENPKIRVAFVSTNSITQGENVSILWPRLLQSGIEIDFAHRTFRWNSDARGKAAVHVVVIGYSVGGNAGVRRLFDYPDIGGQPIESTPKHINPYLIEGDDVLVTKRRTPIVSWIPEANFGSMPNDGGHLIVESVDLDEFLADAHAAKYVRRLVGSRELLNALPRHVLWLKNANPADIVASRLLRDRIEGVRTHRASSERATTRALAQTPTLFGEDRQPTTDYLAIPEVSSEGRPYLAAAWLGADVIATNKLYVVPTADLALFALVSSRMFQTWLATVGGKLKSDYQFSTGMVYNTFPFPELDGPRRTRLQALGTSILSARAKFTDVPLGDLYKPSSMPPELVDAHAANDAVVGSLYGLKEPTLLQRQAALFEAYERLRLPLEAQMRTKGYLGGRRGRRE